jgi:hypothetical protein
LGSAAAATWFEQSLERRAMLLDRLKNGDFARLEEELTAYQQRHEAGEIPESAVMVDYFAFYNSDPALELKLLAWQLAKPDSYAAPVATAMYYARLGWLRRGSEFIEQTDASQIAGMRRYFAESQVHLQRALRINDRLVFAYSEMAATHMAMGNKVESERFLAAGLEKFPSSSIMHRTALTALEARWGGSAKKTRAYFLAHLKQFQDDPSLRPLLGLTDFEEGNALWNRRDYAGAAAAFTKAMAYGKTGIYLHNRGQMYYWLNQLDEAMADQQEAIGLMGNAAAAYAQMAYIKARQRDYAGAIEFADKAVGLDPRNPEFLMGRASLLLFDPRRSEEQRYKDAQTDLDAALEFGAFDPELFSRRRDLFMSTGRLHHAVREAEDAVRLAPADSRVWLGYTEALAATRDCRAFDAREVFQQLCKEDGTCGDAAKRMFTSVMRFMRCGQPGGTP